MAAIPSTLCLRVVTSVVFVPVSVFVDDEDQNMDQDKDADKKPGQKWLPYVRLT